MLQVCSNLVDPLEHAAAKSGVGNTLFLAELFQFQSGFPSEKHLDSFPLFRRQRTQRHFDLVDKMAVRLCSLAYEQHAQRISPSFSVSLGPAVSISSIESGVLPLHPSVGVDGGVQDCAAQVVVSFLLVGKALASLQDTQESFLKNILDAARIGYDGSNHCA